MLPFLKKKYSHVKKMNVAEMWILKRMCGELEG